MQEKRPDPNGLRWFAVRTQPNREQRAQAQLQQQYFTTFLPLVEKSVRHARKLRTVKAALFPGYLFIELDLTRDQWRCINSTYGVSGMIMAGEQPMPVPKGVVETFIDLSSKHGLIDFTADLTIGSSVQVVSGPLSGMLGRLASCDNKGRVEVLLDIMGQQVRVRSQANSLMPA